MFVMNYKGIKVHTYTGKGLVKLPLKAGSCEESVVNTLAELRG